MKMVEEKISIVDEYYRNADLPDAPDQKIAEESLVRIREKFYKGLS